MAFDKFKDYMYYLLHYPIKNSQFYILFTVLGDIFDNIVTDISEVRRQANVSTATGKHLDVFGKEFQMPRIRNEDNEDYRRRLMMKTDISIMAGTKKGTLLLLKALGYEQAAVEPMYLQDKSRWAEFIVALGPASGGVDDILIIDAEVRKIKEASAKPAVYLMEHTMNALESPRVGAWTQQEFQYGIAKEDAVCSVGAWTCQIFEYGEVV